MTWSERSSIVGDPDCFKPYTGPLNSLKKRVNKILGRPREDSTDKHPPRIHGPSFRVTVLIGNSYQRDPADIAREAAGAFRASSEGCWGCPAHSLFDAKGLRVCGGLTEQRMYPVHNDAKSVTYICHGYKTTIRTHGDRLAKLREGNCYKLLAK